MDFFSDKCIKKSHCTPENLTKFWSVYCIVAFTYVMVIAFILEIKGFLEWCYIKISTFTISPKVENDIVDVELNPRIEISSLNYAENENPSHTHKYDLPYKKYK